MLAKDKLNTTEFLISEDLMESCIIDKKYVSMNNVSREHNSMKEAIENLSIR